MTISDVRHLSNNYYGIIIYMNKKSVAKKLLIELKKKFPNPQIELENWDSHFQLMVCVILSAQSTDKSVNKVTKNLFTKYKTPNDFANADISDLESYIASINYYKTKAKRLIEASRYIENVLHGELPKTLADWTNIPGIGQKSANVMIVEQSLKAEGIVVDTHVTRVGNRLGLTTHKDAKKIENDLKELIPEKEWAYSSKAIVLFGRYICKAKKPECSECNLKEICPYYKNIISKEKA